MYKDSKNISVLPWSSPPVWPVEPWFPPRREGLFKSSDVVPAHTKVTKDTEVAISAVSPVIKGQIFWKHWKGTDIMVLHWFKRQSDFKITWGGNQPTCTCSQANPRSAPAVHRGGWRSPHPSSPSSTSSSETIWQKSQERWPFWWPHWDNLIWFFNQLIAHSVTLTGLCFITGSFKDNRDKSSTQKMCGKKNCSFR